MQSNQVAETFINLETIGRVRISSVEVSGDGSIRPYRYFETAIIWDLDESGHYGAHGFIVDSNVATRDEILGVHHKWCNPPAVAELIATTPAYHWDW